jgi:hypothetical protein
VFFDNVWINGWNQSGEGFPGIENVNANPNVIVNVGFNRLFTNAPGGPPSYKRRGQFGVSGAAGGAFDGDAVNIAEVLTKLVDLSLTLAAPPAGF